MAAELVFVFGGRALLEADGRLDALRAAYPGALIVGCSTAGEICGDQVSDDTLSLTAIRFDHTKVVGSEVRLGDLGSSKEAGRRLAQELPKENLRHVFVLSDGIAVNGSELIRGMTEHLPAEVSVTGGLSGDGAAFEKTVVLARSGVVEGAVTAVGLYGDRLKIGYGSLGGWDPFGPERLITHSNGNVLHELDGKRALDLYKHYLGEYASGLPATGLLFPLALRAPESDAALVRTILAVDEEERTMTFAGDVPTGWFARLMRANFDRLVDGAHGAARHSLERIGSSSPEFALLVSCVGRKMVLKQRVEEEVEAVRNVIGSDATITGFYSYGEISPLLPTARCELHNQTMTITTLSEK